MLEQDVNELHDRLRARREGGLVERCHVIPHIGSYQVSSHSYNVAQIIRTFHSNPSLELIGAALDHDVAERWIGDTPATAKWLSPGIKSALDIAEQIVEDNFRIGNTLTFDERWWLKAADLLELFLWSHEQIFMGNRNAKNILDNIGDYVCLREAKIFPQALLEVYRNWTAKRLKELPDSMFQKPK